MKTYVCDNCKKTEARDPKVELHGVSQPSGDILLPDAYHHKDFCSVVCFWKWVKKQLPLAPK